MKNKSLILIELEIKNKFHELFRICVNSLCKNTSAQDVKADLNDCSLPPLKGRYMTMQRVRKEDQDIALAIAEVDCELYI